MDSFKFDAFTKEFPFLAECLVSENGKPLDKQECVGISIKRIVASTLNETPRAYHWSGSMVNINDINRVDFILADGSVIRDAVKCSVTSGSNYAYSDTYEREGETILEAIDRLQVAAALSFIVWTKCGHVIKDHSSQPDWFTVVYKPAKDFTLAEAIAEAKAQAMAEVQAEANF